jgi:hypothetical protein
MWLMMSGMDHAMCWGCGEINTGMPHSAFCNMGHLMCWHSVLDDTLASLQPDNVPTHSAGEED